MVVFYKLVIVLSFLCFLNVLLTMSGALHGVKWYSCLRLLYAFNFCGHQKVPVLHEVVLFERNNSGDLHCFKLQTCKKNAEGGKEKLEYNRSTTPYQRERERCHRCFRKLIAVSAALHFFLNTAPSLSSRASCGIRH